MYLVQFFFSFVIISTNGILSIGYSHKAKNEQICVFGLKSNPTTFFGLTCIIKQFSAALEKFFFIIIIIIVSNLFYNELLFFYISILGEFLFRVCNGLAVVVFRFRFVCMNLKRPQYFKCKKAKKRKKITMYVI